MTKNTGIVSLNYLPCLLFLMGCIFISSTPSITYADDYGTSETSTTDITTDKTKQELTSSHFTLVDEVSSPSGIKAWIIQDHHVPAINISVAIRHAGSVYDLPGKEGTSFLLSKMLDEGAGKYNHRTFKEALERDAIYISASTSRDHIYISLKTLSSNVDQAFHMLSLMLTSPKLSRSTFSREHAAAQAQIKRSMTNPSYLADLQWIKSYFGKHPYGRPVRGTMESLQHINHEDILTFFYAHVGRNNLTFSMAGDITPSQASTLLEKHFSSMIDVPTPPSIIPDFVQPETPSTVRIERSMPQSIAIFGTPGVHYDDPQFYPTLLANYILGGGGFESRLMKKIREERGLAYSVSTSLMSLNHADLIKGSVATRNDAVNTSLTLIDNTMQEMREQGITASELKSAKDYLIGSFILGLDTNASLAGYLTFMQLENMGKDFLNNRNERVRNVTIEQVKAASSKLLHNENMVTVIIGENNTDNSTDETSPH